MKVLALTKYGDLAASTRQRFLQYRPALAEAGIELRCSALFDNHYLAHVLAGEPAPAGTIVRAYLRRLIGLIEATSADLVWLHCEFFPYWPGFTETLAATAIRKPIVFDFDDAIFHMYDASARPMVRLLLSGKLKGLLSRVRACTCGNAYLRDYAARFCSKSIIVPTVVDTDAYRPVTSHGDAPLTIGWIGSPTTWRAVEPLLPVLHDICSQYQARFLVIGAGQAANRDVFPGMELRDWSEATEIGDVQAMDIGIMPLLDRPFERGKSGYKLIQYMACGLPAVASPIGVNAQIVKDGVNGFLASTEQEWRKALAALLESEPLRSRFGSQGRDLVVREFSLSSQKARLIDLFKSLA